MLDFMVPMYIFKNIIISQNVGRMGAQLASGCVNVVMELEETFVVSLKNERLRWQSLVRHTYLAQSLRLRG